MLGAGSGLGQAAMAVLTLALTPLSTQLALPGGWILTAAQAAPIAISVMLWVFVRRGGMVSRSVVVALWWLAAAGLAGIALIPAGIGWIFIPVAAGGMTLVGVGVAAGYHVQANKLAYVTGHGSGMRSRVSGAAGLAQRWTLILGIAAPLLVGLVMQRFGARAGIATMSALVGAYATAHIVWRGLPDRRPGVGRGAVCSLVRQSAGTQRDTLGSFVLYGVWGALYPVVALLGAGPVTQAWIMIVARGVAAAFVVWLGRLADRDRQRVVRVATLCAAGGVVLLMLFRSGLGWGPAAVGVTMTELGANGIAGAIKGSLAHGEDRVRQTQLGFLFRFAGFGLIPLALEGIWVSLTRGSIQDAREVVAASVLVALLGLVLAVVPRVVRHPGTHPIKAPGQGTIYLAVLPPAPWADRLWLYVWVEGSHRGRWIDDRGRERNPGWAFFELAPGGLLTVVDRSFGGTLLEVRSLRRRRSGRPLEVGWVTLRPAWTPGFPGRATELVTPNAGGGDEVVVGTLERLTVMPVSVRATMCRPDALPQWLIEDRPHAPRKMRRDVTNGPVTVYEIRSPALGGVRHGEGHRSHGRRESHRAVSLRINSMVFPPGQAG